MSAGHDLARRNNGTAAVAEKLAATYHIRVMLISPPRTGSTPVARLLWQHSAITHHCHEPFEASYWGGAGDDSVAANLFRPMRVDTGDRIDIDAVPPGSGVLIKEMSFQLDPAQFRFLAEASTTPVVFVLRDPRLSTVSRLHIVDELSGARTFPPDESGWPALAEQVRLCRKHAIPYALVDSTDLRTDPAGIAGGLLAALGLPAEAGLGAWQPRPDLDLCAPEVRELMGERRRADDPFYRRVLGSAGIEPPDAVDWAAAEALIDSAGLAGQVAGWRADYAELRADPALVRPEPAS